MSKETEDMDQTLEDAGRLILSLAVCAVLLVCMLIGTLIL